MAGCLHSAAIHLLRRLRKQDVAAGLSAARLSILSVLVFGGPRTLGELAAAEQVRPPTMTRLIAGLEADGLVLRLADREDRRIARVRVTAKGVRILQEGRDRRVGDLATRMSALDSGEVALLRVAAGIMERVARGED